MYIYSNTTANLLFAETSSPMADYSISTMDGTEVSCPLMKSEALEGGFRYTLDASALQPWSPATPVLYYFEACGEKVRFGHSTLRPFENKSVLMNGSPIFLRGYIRGIVAHEHPNMTGGSLRDAALKNISQAKKYGFNLVRYHSTIPNEEFVEAADELGLLIHLEIGFAYDYDEQGNKKNLSMNNTAWRDTILRYRNHPSIAIFCIGNEMHNSGHFKEVRALYEEGRSLAPNKLIMDNSGWGEYDRDTADIYSQHIAYFFPFKHHGEMFLKDDPWRLNGSVSDEPLETSTATASVKVSARRYCTPLRPTISHEACHYIEIPDYDALSRKYDAFAAKVSPEYLQANDIKKPRFMADLPALIARKGLTDLMADYRNASEQFKMQCLKIFIERLRFSHLCGFEMLQFADCLKYENKNGIVDCFDDDKFIPAPWMREFTGDLAILADFDDENHFYGQPVRAHIAVSDFLPKPEIHADLTVTLDGEVIYSGKAFALAGGLQTLVDLEFTRVAKPAASVSTLVASLSDGTTTYHNSWKLWFYPAAAPAKPEANLCVMDKIDEALFQKLDEGATVLLNYRYDLNAKTLQFPGAIERFKPCIWDRGSNLGGVLRNDTVRNALGGERYFDLNMQPLLEAGSKVNLDHFPCPVEEHILGVDKPVRDRMKGLLHHIKDFIDDDTLRRFTHLFSLRVGKGLLIVCTLNFAKAENPAVLTLQNLLLTHPEAFDTTKSIPLADFRSWLEETNKKGFQPEDVMNHFWEIDNKPVEDTLFWEEVQVDLSKIKE